MAESMTAPELELAPEPPPKGPRIWLRDNLFSTPASGVMSVVAAVIIVLGFRGLLDFVFAPGRRWDADTYNMKLLMVQAYPQGDMWRVWLTVGIIVVLVAASIAVWKLGGMVEPRQVGKILMGFGGGVALAGLIGPFSTSARLLWIGVGAAFLLGGYALRAFTGDRAKEPIIPILGLVGILVVVIIAILWVIQVPVPAKIIDGVPVTDGAIAGSVRAEQVIVHRPVANSTTIPWTIIAIVGILTYAVVRMATRNRANGGLKRVITTMWLLAFPVLVLIVLRSPEVDWSRFLSVYLPALVVFGLIGSVILGFVSRPGIGEVARVLGAVLLVAAVVTWFFPMPMVVRFLMLALAIFALAGPTFGGEGARGLIGAWLTADVLITFSILVIATPSGIDVPGNFFLGGLSLTIVLAFTSIVLSFPLGVILALGRTSTMPIFRLLCTAYIELIRGVPLITWLLVAFLMLPVALPQGVEIGGVMRAVGAMTLFSAAYLAENVRGGLQSIPGGQREASRALGMSTLQMTVFITLPQALRAVIPALVGQVIAVFKDTSLVTIVGLFDFLHIARQIIPAQSQPFSFLGSIKETLIFAAIVYWMFTFTFSRISLRLEKKLGVGER
jgi:general L-amino acid transport system permease protein